MNKTEQLKKLAEYMGYETYTIVNTDGLFIKTGSALTKFNPETDAEQ